jgi:hypothetical protein
VSPERIDATLCAEYEPPMDRKALEEQLALLAKASRERRSVDGFMRAAIEGFLWAILGGVCGKLLWDSARLPFFFYPLALLDLLLFWDGAKSYLQARIDLRRELLLEERVRALRLQLGIDEPAAPPAEAPARSEDEAA